MVGWLVTKGKHCLRNQVPPSIVAPLKEEEEEENVMNGLHQTA